MNNKVKLSIFTCMVCIALLYLPSCSANQEPVIDVSVHEAEAGSVGQSEQRVDETVWPIGQWQRSTPGEQGMDAEAIDNIEQYFVSLDYNVEGMLIVRNGQLVKESYYGGYQADTRHQIFSVTKSVLSSLIGIALEEGAIESLDQKISEYYPELNEDPDASKQDITIKHLLTMTSGIDWPELLISYTSPDNPLVRMYEHNNQIDYILARQMRSKPGERYNYSTADSHLLSGILQKAVGRTAEQYAAEKLFAPLGITDFEWPADNQGVSLGGAGLFLLPVDMARFGYLYLQNGLWVDQQVVPESWVEQSTILQASGQFQYGYQWRIGKDGDYYAMGYRGQFILVSPSHELVVVFTADMPNEFLPLSLFDQIKSAVRVREEGGQ